jgi:H+/Cl- antiporter ClcA
MPGVFSELAKRLRWEAEGGAGESAVWGEPLFYIIIIGAFTGLIGAILGVALVAIIRRERRREMPRSKESERATLYGLILTAAGLLTPFVLRWAGGGIIPDHLRVLGLFGPIVAIAGIAVVIIQEVTQEH